jgi:hypothetical protein
MTQITDARTRVDNAAQLAQWDLRGNVTVTVVPLPGSPVPETPTPGYGPLLPKPWRPAQLDQILQTILRR